MATNILSMRSNSRFNGSGRNFNASDFFNHSQKAPSLRKYLIKAIMHDEFELVFQPQTELDGHQVIGVEALLRWNSPELGYVMPTDFIPVAEDTGLILDLGKMVIQKACQQAALWKKQYGSKIRMAVNVSYKQVHDNHIVTFVESQLNLYGLDVSTLEIELTESSLINDTPKVIRVLNEFKEMGIRTAIDDFGTGCSSLSYLASMPFDMIKIDKSFISLLGINHTNTTITESIIQLSKNLNMEVLAEGVETLMQKKILIENKCNLMQGNLFSRPVSADELPVIAGMCVC